MKKQVIIREYNFSDADLYTWSTERLHYAKRDAAEFERSGFGQYQLEAFEHLCRRFASIPADDELLGQQMNTTAAKDQAREALLKAIRSVMVRVRSVYSPRSGHYRKFGTTKLAAMDDPKLLLCGLRVGRVAERMQEYLIDSGLVQEHIDEVKRCAKAFEQALHNKHDKVADRDIAVERRVELGNQLYQELILLSNIGKDIWNNKDRARYEQYVLYESNNEQKKARKEREQESEDSSESL